MILPDFQNLYTNKSYLSRDEQVRLFRRLTEIAKNQITDAAERYMQISLHGLLFSILSETGFSETVFMAADMISNQLLAMYLERLRPDNILVTSDLDETMDYHSEAFRELLLDYLDLLQNEIPKQFTIMIFPYRMLEKDFEQWQEHIDRMLAYRGRIILYDCPDSVFVTKRFYLMTDVVVSQGRTIKVLQSNSMFIPSKINLAVSSAVRKLQEDIISFVDHKVKNVRTLDKLIYDAWELERDVIKYHDEFPEEDMKYKINEIKNSLLDLRYSEEADMLFFMENLKKDTLALN